MKLLIITQTVDTQDTTLGFFHRWIEEFSKRVESVEVIALRVGEHTLPKNVRVHSLEKEKGNGRLRRIFLFFYFSIFYSSDYDVVFVHMNQEYILLGGLLWKIWGKKIFLWRNHPRGSFLTHIAVSFCHTVFCTSTSSFTARYKKTILMPAGIDTKLFVRNPNVERVKNSLVMFGRIAPIKKIEVAIDAVAQLKKAHIDCTLSIIGDILPRDEGYLEILKDRVEIAGLGAIIHFEKGVPFSQAPGVYQRHEVFLNFTPSGSFDKTVIEALACGSRVLVSNESMKNMLPEESVAFLEGEEVVRKIDYLLILDQIQLAQYNEQAREIVQKQSLDTLMEKLFEVFTENS